MIKSFNTFVREEAGAVSVDFVTLSSIIIVMTFGLIGMLQSGNLSIGGKLSAKVSATEVAGN